MWTSIEPIITSRMRLFAGSRPRENRGFGWNCRQLSKAIYVFLDASSQEGTNLWLVVDLYVHCACRRAASPWTGHTVEGTVPQKAGQTWEMPSESWGESDARWPPSEHH